MTNITKEMLNQALQKVKEEWKKELDLMKLIITKEQEEKRKELDTRIEDLETENKLLKLKISHIESKNSGLDSDSPSLFSSLFAKSKLDVNETKVLNAISAETKEKLTKEKNVAIFGLIESNSEDKNEKIKHDKVVLDEIFKDLNFDNSKIEKHYRLKSNDASKYGIVIVELNNKLYQQQVLQEAKNLNTNEKYKNKVYINLKILLLLRERILNYC